MTRSKIYTATFVGVYPLYIQRVGRKNRTQAEADEIVYWLTNYSEEGLQQQSAQKVTMETFFEEAPNFNENAQLVKGVICDYRVEGIEDPLVQRIRYLDKLIDGLAKGKAIEKVLGT